jgi:hypothetical protein
MTSGARSLAAAVLLVAAAASRGEAPARLAVFLATLAPPPDVPLPFVERRMSSLLATPLEMRGELTLGADGSIDKRVTAPAEERVLIAGGTLTLERDGSRRTLDLGGDARLRAFNVGIVGLMRRDAQAIDRVFECSLEEGAAGWTLTLRPRSVRGANALTVIRASGAGPRLLTLRLEQGEGEWQEMAFADPVD